MPWTAQVMDVALDTDPCGLAPRGAVSGFPRDSSHRVCQAHQWTSWRIHVHAARTAGWPRLCALTGLPSVGSRCSSILRGIILLGWNSAPRLYRSLPGVKMLGQGILSRSPGNGTITQPPRGSHKKQARIKPPPETRLMAAGPIRRQATTSDFRTFIAPEATSSPRGHRFVGEGWFGGLANTANVVEGLCRSPILAPNRVPGDLDHAPTKELAQPPNNSKLPVLGPLFAGDFSPWTGKIVACLMEGKEAEGHHPSLTLVLPNCRQFVRPENRRRASHHTSPFTGHDHLDHRNLPACPPRLSQFTQGHPPLSVSISRRAP